jgi:hypothetical protein
MKQKNVEKIVNNFPSIIKNIIGYLKNNFDKSAQDTLSNATGTLGIFIKLFAQEKIDKYFDSLTKEKLADFGSNIYLKASLLQVGKSMEAINSEVIQIENAKSVIALLIDTLDEITFNSNDVLTIFTPQYHPIVVFIKEQMQSLLNTLNIHPQVIKSFTRDFNKNIEATLKEAFGDKDYAKHLEEIKEFVLDKSESKLLYDMYELRKIGFRDGESLHYERAYGSWKSVSLVLDKDENRRVNQDKEEEQRVHEEIEASLKPMEELIDEYFETCHRDCIQNILFVVADFGKGKTVFLRQYASKLAKSYSERHEGYIPIYFNLRNFERYSSDGSLGVLGSFLLDEYGIKIDSEKFRKKKYFFLVDSLDESGELTKSKIDRVIESIKSIQNIDKVERRDNRILITSRPFSEALEAQMKAHKPYTIIDKNGNEVAQYISLYGFKEEQFNSWLFYTLKNSQKLGEIETTGFVQEIIEAIKRDELINIYQKLFEEKTLSRAELRRPIFAYMIYQLILNSVDFLSIGKIGIYLSFINLLTKEAKHIDDRAYRVNHKDEIHYRTILHSISALWMYERQQGRQGVLKKADICRVLDGEDRKESDREILERYKIEGVTEIEFLSHSYFGEEDNYLHFQHQSFAEILLAEYYLKVFIKYAIDKKQDIEKARSRLILGEPTEQTVEFFKELLYLLKDTVSSNPTDEVIEKRKLLYPLMATLANERYNSLYCERIDTKWFEDVEIDNNSATIHPELLENWAIGKRELERIIGLAKEIIDSKSTLLLAKTERRTALFDSELTLFQNARVSDSPTDMDKWLALVVGNLLYDNKPEERDFFNGKLENPENLFEMIRGWSYYKQKSGTPSWSREFFKGVTLKQEGRVFYDFRSLMLNDINFSYSNFKNLGFYGSTLIGTSFNYCKLNNISFYRASLLMTTFDNVLELNNIVFIGALLDTHILIPMQLVEYFDIGLERRYPLYKKLNQKTKIFIYDENRIFYTLKGLLIYGLKNNLFDIPEIKSWFDYESEEDREMFEGLIDKLEY